ncbi:MAG: hypothetical protein AAGG08_08830 [Actinomycetota bacterium]
MFCWYIGTACLAVGFVFRDPRFDYRLLVVGSVLPLLDGFFGGARALHAITTSIALLAVLMLATAGRKPIRSTLLGLPIGMFLHLVFDGAWNDTDTFWWPITGWEFTDEGAPVVDRGVWSIVLEVIGVVICAWLVRHNRLTTADGRAAFRRDGHLVTVPDRFA